MCGEKLMGAKSCCTNLGVRPLEYKTCRTKKSAMYTKTAQSNNGNDILLLGKKLFL